jgi:hypothetical protein
LNLTESRTESNCGGNEFFNSLLGADMAGRVYIYVVAGDFGFAPNPFHGFCTLATCKPRIRATAKLGDWIVGMGGADLNAVGRCIYAMRVSKALNFNEYWKMPEYRCKRPV